MSRKRTPPNPLLTHILSPEYRAEQEKRAAEHEATLRRTADEDGSLLSDIEMHLNDSHNCGTCYDLWQRLNGIKKRR